MKGMLLMNWLLTETDNPVNILSLYVLSHILVGTVASPLRKALIDSDLGEDMVGVGLDGELRQVYFSAGLKGIKADPDGNLPAGSQIEDLILQTLETLVRDGIDPEMVAAALNTVEFRLRENNTGSFPQGLMLMLSALTTWLYEGDPMEPLAFEMPLIGIKDQLNAGAAYFEEMIRRFLLDNQHRTTVVLRPQPGLQAQRDQEEKRWHAKA
jgi:Zn-dependent M16 (insulinase) family peptidase